jgi:FkbM family methyltransferase
MSWKTIFRRSARRSEGEASSSPTVDGGYETAYAMNVAYDDEAAAVIAKVLRDGEVAIDVGAHNGTVLRKIVDASPSARHHAFEPLPQCAQKLRESFPGVEVHECALSDEAGTKEFHFVTNYPEYSGLRRRRYDLEGAQVELISVRVERLDDVMDDDANIRFMKIDVEGGELGVLRGGLGLLARCRPFIVFEHGLGAADFYGTRPQDVWDLLVDGVGLDVNLMRRWLDGSAALSRNEFADEFESGRNFYYMASPR